MTTSDDYCACGKERAHLDADPDSQEWACRVPEPTESVTANQREKAAAYRAGWYDGYAAGCEDGSA